MLSALDLYQGLFITSAILFNLLIAGIFVADKHGHTRAIQILGVAWLCLALPLSVVFARFAIQGVELWVRATLGLALIYMLVELLLDYILQYDFREHWRTHIPYIVLEYLALFSLIAIAIWIDPGWGWVVSGSFWILLACLIYLYAGRRKQAHAGRPEQAHAGRPKQAHAGRPEQAHVGRREPAKPDATLPD